MKGFEKLKQMKFYQKIVILILVTIGIAIFNFFYYNYQILKINKNDRNYTVKYHFANENQKDLSQLFINLEGKYVKDLIINYDTKEDFSIHYTGEVANEYGIFKEYENEDKCFSYTNICGININQKVGILNLQIDKPLQSIEISINNTLTFNWITFAFWSILINLLLIILMFFKQFQEKLHVLSFLICISLGTILLLCTHNMTSTTLDDDSHYKMANILNKTNPNLSISDYYLENYISLFLVQDTKIEKEVFQKFLDENAKNYTEITFKYNNLLETNKLCYLPMALTLKITNLIGLPFTSCFFLARFVQLVFYSFLMAVAVKLMPNYKILTMVIAIIPQSLFLATNFSYDPTVTSCLTLAFAAFANEFMNKEKKLNLMNVLIFVLAGLFGIFPKAVFAPFILLMLLLPKEKFQSIKQKRAFKLIIIVIFLIGILTFILPILFNPNSSNDIRGGNVSVPQQIKLIISSPISFIKVFWENAVLDTANRLLSPSTFGLLSYYGGMESDTSYYLFILAIILAFFTENNAKSINKKEKIIMISIYLLIFCFIWGSMYLAFTPVGEAVINGVQSRYFIPFLLPLLYCFQTEKWSAKIENNNSVTIVTILCILSFALLIYKIIILDYCL